MGLFTTPSQFSRYDIVEYYLMQLEVLTRNSKESPTMFKRYNTAQTQNAFFMQTCAKNCLSA
jgi:DNA primase